MGDNFYFNNGDRILRGFDFMYYNMFGISLDDIFCCSNDKEIGELLIETAISRAYRDAVDRVLIKEGYNKENENGWIKNRKAAENIVKNHINQLMDGNFNFELAKENAPEEMKNDSEVRNFDYWHWSLTNELAIKINENNVTTFSCGIAQKWINMTFKYLVVLLNGTYIWDECFWDDDSVLANKIPQNFIDMINGYYPYFHVPIDGYILKAINKSMEKYICEKDYKNRKDDIGQIAYGLSIKTEDYIDEAWSKLRIDKYYNYFKLQNEIRKKVDIFFKRKYTQVENSDMWRFYPLDWENNAWIAELRSVKK